MKRMLFALLSVIVLTGCTTWTAWETAFTKASESDHAEDSSPHPVSLNGLFLHPIDCELPCFGGLRPGVSTETEIIDFLDRFATRYPRVGVSKDGTDSYYGISMSPKPAGHLRVEFLVEHQQLLRMHLTLANPYQWIARLPVDLPTILEKIGKPDEVLLLFGGPPLFFDLYLVYANRGIMVRYDGVYQDPDLVNQDTPLPICLQPHIVDLQLVNIWLEDRVNGTFLDEELPRIKADRDTRPLWDIERIGGLSVADFTTFFLDNPQGCLPIKSASELREMGYVF